MPISKLTHGNKHMAVCFSWTWGGYLVKVSRALARSWTRTTGTNNAVKRTVLSCLFKQHKTVMLTQRCCSWLLQQASLFGHDETTRLNSHVTKTRKSIVVSGLDISCCDHAWTSMSIRQALTTCWNMFEQCCSFNTPVVHCKKNTWEIDAKYWVKRCTHSDPL